MLPPTGIGPYGVAPVYGDYQVDQAGLIQPAPVAPQGVFVFSAFASSQQANRH
jgi:hypothetical protein